MPSGLEAAGGLRDLATIFGILAETSCADAASWLRFRYSVRMTQRSGTTSAFDLIPFPRYLPSSL